MAIFKTTSVQEIIGKVYRDLALEDPNYESDIIEWCGEALSFIGASSQFEQVQTEITVASYKAALPSLFVSMIQLKYEDQPEKWKLISYNPKSFRAHEDDSPNLFVATEESFSLDPDYIVTSFEEGTILLSYKAIATDDDGYPLVPDNQYFKEALFWYCYRQILLRGYKSRVPEINYLFADQKWKFYCTAARNKANYPSVEEYDRFRRIWVGLLPSSELHKAAYDERELKEKELETISASNIVTTPITVDSDE